MSSLVTDVLLLPEEKIIKAVPVPFQPNRPRLGLDIIVDLLTDSRKKMPIGARALDKDTNEGIYEAEFARDALIMSAFVAETMPEITEITVRRLCELQGVTDRSEGGKYADREEVGRIPHEIRDEDDPRRKEYTERFGWQWPYFGAIDTTPLFINAVVRAAAHNPEILQDKVTQSDGVERSVAECLVRAIEWLWKKLKNSPIGLLETRCASNNCWMVWQDSPDAYHHVDGALAKGSVAALEVQAFVYDAMLAVADMVRAGLLPGDPNYVWMRAQRLRRAVIEHTWVVSPELGGYFAAGVERNGVDVRPLAVRTANMGMLLNSRILDDTAYQRHVEAIVLQMMDNSGLWSHSGIRTLAEGEVRFRPQSYHTGSVWPWQNLWIAKGLRHHGHGDLARMIESKMKLVAKQTRCAPEFVQGVNDFHVRVNEAMVDLRSPDGHGDFFEHLAMQPPQHFQGFTAFGLYALELGEGFERPVDVLDLESGTRLNS